MHLGHDNLLGRYAGADGIKTGYTNASGFNLVSSVVRGGAHVIGVVMGGYSAHRRDMEMMRILDWTFAQINAQPTLVARAAVPWQTIAQNANPSPTIAGFQFGSGATGQPHITRVPSTVNSRPQRRKPYRRRRLLPQSRPQISRPSFRRRATMPFP